MTTELEKQFFDTFGIKPKIKDLTPAQILYSDIERLEYPQITDRYYLELICVLNGYCLNRQGCNYILYATTLDYLKTEILNDFLNKYEEYDDFREVKHQVQAIFEGE